jgi:Ni,Fe-hydrogenase maturation factor
MIFPQVIGLGSHHGDDTAGWLIIDHLRELGYPLNLLRKVAHPADLLEELSFTARLLICDACERRDDAGKIYQWQWPNDSLIHLRSGGTHDLTLAQALELAEQFAEHRLQAEICA